MGCSSSKQITFRRRIFGFRKRGTTVVYCCTRFRTTVVFRPAVLCITNSNASCISHGAQPLSLLDQLVNLLKLTCLHTVHSTTVVFRPAVFCIANTMLAVSTMARSLSASLISLLISWSSLACTLFLSAQIALRLFWAATAFGLRCGQSRAKCP